MLNGDPWRGREPTAGEPRADRPAARPAPKPTDEDRGAAGGIAFAAGATNFFGLVPLDSDLMAGARLTLALAAPSESSRWLSNATFGLTGGVDAGKNRGVDAQVYHAGAVFSLGAPWSRDVLGVSVEGGILGSRYYDANPVAFRQSTKQTAPGPLGEGLGPKLYALGRLIVQAPIKGDVRPFIAGEFGVTERRDDKVSAIAGLTGGLVWNAW